MSPTLRELYDVVADRLPTPPVTAGWELRLAALADRLPFTDLAGLEARLGGSDPQVDLIVRLPQGPFDPPDPTDPVWRRVMALCAERATPGSVVNAAVNVLDLEYDLPAAATPRDPAVFFELERESAPDPDRLAALTTLAAGEPVSEALHQRLRDVVAALPPEGRVIHLGAMLSRPGSPLRLVASRLPPESVAAVSERLSGVPRSVIDPVLAEVTGRVDTVCVSFDVAATGPTGRVSFEGFVAAGPERAHRLEELFDALLDQGRCTRAERDALIGWPGTDDGSRMPCHAVGERLMRGFAASVVARFLSHVKWSVKADGTSATKVYFGMAHYWMTPGATPPGWEA